MPVDNPSGFASPLPKLDPDIRLYGDVDKAMLDHFLSQLQTALQGEGPLLLELTTLGGDADFGRRMAQEVRLCREQRGRDLWFIGKATVYSAGVTIMSAFPPDRRILTRDTVILIHERKMKKTLKLEGAMRASRAIVMDALAEIDAAQAVERMGFEHLVEGTGLSIDTLMTKVMTQNWYLTADEALGHGLVGGVL
jgi:ATP-dependent protease ClpP protease subunit